MSARLRDRIALKRIRANAARGNRDVNGVGHSDATETDNRPNGTCAPLGRSRIAQLKGGASVRGCNTSPRG